MAQNTYELTYVINGVLNDDQIRGLVNRVRKFIEENDGEIIEVDEWGTRRLAYPINKKRNGYYVNLFFKSEGDLIGRLERALGIEDDILRYLTLKMDAKMLRHYEASKVEAAEKAEAAAEKEAEAAVAAAAAEDEDEEDEEELEEEELEEDELEEDDEE